MGCEELGSACAVNWARFTVYGFGYTQCICAHIAARALVDNQALGVASVRIFGARFANCGSPAQHLVISSVRIRRRTRCKAELVSRKR